MTVLDWAVFIVTLVAIIVYGMWRGRGQQETDAYLRAGRSMPWYMVLLGVMATQASAITFLSAPGQAFTDGMRFVQYYFGLPIAMIVIAVTFIPIFRKQNVYTAYEYLEQRFDRKTRLITSALFLLSRGLSTGISIYAPSIIVSSLLGWSIYLTNIVVGGMLLLYTLRGGARSIAYTQTLMFGIILAAMLFAGIELVQQLPSDMTFSDALTLADLSGRLNIITTNFDLHDKYNLWSGIIGGFFLALSYFGTDQSQVGRFLTGKNVKESRIGLLVNGVVKIPMQFGILLIGALLVSLYAVVPSPIFFNEVVANQVREREPAKVQLLEQRWDEANSRLQSAAARILEEHPIVIPSRSPDQSEGEARNEEYRKAQSEVNGLRAEYRQLVKQQGVTEASDTNYIFLHFVRTTLPSGLVGLLFAVVILASWGSISAAFHSLATASYVDLQVREQGTGNREHGTWNLAPSTWTLIWGVLCIAISMAATQMGSLIEAVNVLGSLFYGPILGIFLVAFYVKRADGTSVFWGALIAEAIVVGFWWFDVVSFLWLNVVGAVVVVMVSALSSVIRR